MSGPGWAGGGEAAPRPDPDRRGAAQSSGHHDRCRRDRRPARRSAWSSGAWTPGAPSGRRPSTSRGCWRRYAGCSARRSGRCGPRRGTRPRATTRGAGSACRSPRSRAGSAARACYRLGSLDPPGQFAARPPVGQAAGPGQDRARPVHAAGQSQRRQQARLRTRPVPGRMRGRAPG